MNGPDAAARASLAAVIERDLEAITRIEPALHELTPEGDYSRCAGVAYALHNLYCALENSFDQISRSFENHIVDREQWHRELIRSSWPGYGAKPLFPRAAPPPSRRSQKPPSRWKGLARPETGEYAGGVTDGSLGLSESVSDTPGSLPEVRGTPPACKAKEAGQTPGLRGFDLESVFRPT
jgi:hypothetical protein